MAIEGLVGELAGQTLADGLHVLPGQGNSLAITTDEGVVVVDASTIRHAAGMIEALRTHTDDPVHAIVYSHGHHGYNAAVPTWLADAEERGHPPPRLVAHERLVDRYARYRETDDLQVRMAAVQFPGRNGVPLELLRSVLELHDPTETFGDAMWLVEGSRPIELLHVPSETDDALAMWLPADGILYGGAATPGATIPNIGTPLRTQRFTIRWAESLDRMLALEADRLITEFGPVVEGPAAVREWLAGMADALRWLRSEVVERMNRGMDEGAILADLDYPDALFDRPWMNPTYGDPTYIVRDLYREENGWWDRNPTTLHPAPPADAAAAVLSAITDRAAVVARARELAESGETQLALHVVDLLAAARDDDPDVAAARALKAELCRTRAGEVPPYVSKALYASTARLIDGGGDGWQDLR